MFVKASGVIVLFTLVLIVVGAQQTEIANEVKDMNVNPTVNGTNTKDIGNTNYVSKFCRQLDYFYLIIYIYIIIAFIYWTRKKKDRESYN